MKITPEQERILNSLKVERLCANRVDNLRLIETFSNEKNPNLVKIIKLQRTINRDESGTIAYYVVKAPSGEMLMYFSLKCGELFEALDLEKMVLAQKLWNAIDVLQNPKKYEKEKVSEANEFIDKNIDEIKSILPNIDTYKRKKQFYEQELQKELNARFMELKNEEDLLPVYFSPANPGDNGAVFLTTAEISQRLHDWGSIPKPMALNVLGRVIQRMGYLPRKSNGKQGYVVYVNQDLDSQRKLDARSATDGTG